MALVLSGSIDISGSMTATTIIVSAPGAPGMVSSSNQLVELNTATGSLIGITNGLTAYTASLKGAIEVSGQNVNVLGTLTAQEIYTTYVTSSILFKSGSTKFGDDTSDKHEFTGSLTARLGTNENLNIFSLGSGDMRLSALNDTANSNVQLSVQAYPLIFKTAGGLDVIRITTGSISSGRTEVTGSFNVYGEIRMDGSTLFRGMSSNTLQLCGGTSSSNIKINGATEVITMDTNGATRVTIASSGTTTFGGAVDTSENLIYSKRTSPSNVNSGATTVFTITQKSGEFQSTYMISIIGLYDSGGANQNGYYTGLATFFNDGAVAQAAISGLHSNGWSASAAATLGGSFTVTFTNAAATTMTNIRITALKINAT
jgi:hypothetical protein